MKDVHTRVTGQSRFGAQRNYMEDGVDLYLWHRDGRDWERVTVAREIMMEEVDSERGGMMHPFVTVPMEAAQMLIDELWNAGLRPKYAKATDETTAAQKAHIADLREVVVRLLEISGPVAGRSEG